MQSLHSSTLRASPLEPLRKSPNGTSRRSTSKKVSYISATVTPKISAPKREKDPKKRVVITGTGLASVFGNDVDTYYEKLLAGESGIGPIDSIRSLVLCSHIGIASVDFGVDSTFYLFFLLNL